MKRAFRWMRATMPKSSIRPSPPGRPSASVKERRSEKRDCEGARERHERIEERYESGDVAEAQEPGRDAGTGGDADRRVARKYGALRARSGRVSRRARGVRESGNLRARDERGNLSPLGGQG